MFEKIIKLLKGLNKREQCDNPSKDTAKERLHLVLMQDRANVSADFLELMKQEIIEVIKKYIDIDEQAIDVKLTNKQNEDGTNGAPSLYANIPIVNVRNDMKKEVIKSSNKEETVIENIDNSDEDKKEKEEPEEVEKHEEQIENIEENNKEEDSKHSKDTKDE